MLACCCDKIYNFPEKSEVPKFILPVKICKFFYCFRGGSEKFAEITAGSLSHLAASPLHFMLATYTCTLLLCMHLCSNNDTKSFGQQYKFKS